jgi:hypothetical protein
LERHGRCFADQGRYVYFVENSDVIFNSVDL